MRIIVVSRKRFAMTTLSLSTTLANAANAAANAARKLGKGKKAPLKAPGADRA